MGVADPPAPRAAHSAATGLNASSAVALSQLVNSCDAGSSHFPRAARTSPLEAARGCRERKARDDVTT